MLSKFKWDYLALAYLALFCLGLIDNTRGAFYPEFLKDLALSSTEGSRLFSIVALSGFLMNFTTRYWLPHIGIVKAVTTSLFFMAVGTVLISTLPYCGEYKSIALIVFALIMGLGIGGSTISMNLLVSKGTPAEYLSRAFAGLHSTYGVSSLIAPLIFTWLFSYFKNWHFPYMALAPIPFLIGIYFLVRSPQEISDLPKKPLEAPISFSKRLPFGLMLAFYVMSEVLLSTRLVYFLTETRSFNLSDANFYLFLFFLGLAIGRILFSFVTFKGSLFSHLFISHVLSLACAVLGFRYPLLFTFCGFTMSWYFPTTMAWMKSKFHHGFDFMTASMLTTSGFLLLGMHDVFGRIAEVTSIETAFKLAPVAGALSLVLLIYLEFSNRNPESSQ